MSMKNSDDTIRNRTRDLPTCSACPVCRLILNLYFVLFQCIKTNSFQQFHQSRFSPFPILPADGSRSSLRNFVTFFMLKIQTMSKTYVTRIKIQGEHKVFPSSQTFITRKLRGIQAYFFYHYLSQFLKKRLFELSYI